MQITFSKNNETIVSVELTRDENGAFLVDGNELPLDYIVAYGLKQSLADSYAGDAAVKDCLKSFRKRMAKILANEMIFGAGGGGGARVDAVTRLARTMAANAIVSAHKAKKLPLPKQPDIDAMARKLVAKDQTWVTRAEAAMPKDAEIDLSTIE